MACVGHGVYQPSTMAQESASSKDIPQVLAPAMHATEVAHDINPWHMMVQPGRVCFTRGASGSCERVEFVFRFSHVVP